MVGDPIGDLIVRIKNAGAVGHERVVLPYSNLKMAIAEKLKSAGYVSDVATHGKKTVGQTLAIVLAYNEDGTHKITGATRVSKPGRRMYVSVAKMHPVRYGKGALILSTSKGILTDTEAREQKVGGEALFKIW